MGLRRPLLSRCAGFSLSMLAHRPECSICHTISLSNEGASHQPGPAPSEGRTAGGRACLAGINGQISAPTLPMCWHPTLPREWWFAHIGVRLRHDQAASRSPTGFANRGDRCGPCGSQSRRTPRRHVRRRSNCAAECVPDVGHGLAVRVANNVTAWDFLGFSGWRKTAGHASSISRVHESTRFWIRFARLNTSGITTGYVEA